MKKVTRNAWKRTNAGIAAALLMGISGWILGCAPGGKLSADPCGEAAEGCKVDCFSDSGISGESLEPCTVALEQCLAADPSNPECAKSHESCMTLAVEEGDSARHLKLNACLDGCERANAQCSGTALPRDKFRVTPNYVNDSIQKITAMVFECINNIRGNVSPQTISECVRKAYATISSVATGGGSGSPESTGVASGGTLVDGKCYSYCPHGSADDPDEDGWGWTGQASCVVKGSSKDTRTRC